MRGGLVAGVILLSAVGVTGQEPLVFRSSVEMVRLDVAVTRDGRAVKGLTGADFQVKDNGTLLPVEVVGQEERTVHAVLALDNSGSLAGDRMARLKVAAHSVLDVLRPDDAVSLLTFSSHLELKAGPDTPRAEVHEAIEATEAQLTTALYDATFAAVTLADPELGRPVVLVFTDGQDVGSWLQPEQVLRAARSADLVSHAVVSGPGETNAAFLEELASATGGEVWKVENEGLEETFLSVLEEFRSRYTLQYAAEGDERETWHDIEVKVPGARVRVREGYLRRPASP